MEPTQILDKRQKLFLHSHLHCEMVFVFPLGILPRLKPVSYTHIQISFPFSPEQIVAKEEVFLQVCSPHIIVLQNFQ